jgi:putative nucleotidyltransferase with HDIG domain
MELVLSDVVRDIRNLPSLPAVVMEVLNTFEQPDVDTGLLADKVAKDQALAAKTLRLANSSFYGLQRKVNTLQQAITILGFDSVRTLIAAAAVTDNFYDNRCALFDSRSFWMHSVGAALCAKMIARELHLNQDYAFVSGLLHDIGKLVLATRFPEQYAQAMAYRSENDCFAIEAERAVLGVDHTQVGQALAEYWKFPVSMQDAIGSHHTRDGQNLDGISVVVHIAESLAHALDLADQDDELVPAVDDAAWDRMGLDAAAFKRVCRNMEAEFETACQILVK